MCKKSICLVSFVLVLGMAAGVANAQAVIKNGLVGYYPLDEGEGDTAYDMSGMGHDGTLYNGVTWISPGFKNGGINNDGTPGSRIALGTWNPAEGTGQLSLALWIRWAHTGTRWQGLIGKRNAWGATGAMMFYFSLDQDNDTFHFARYGQWVIPPAGVMTPFIDKWAHAAVTFDGTTARIYLNGEEIRSGEFSFADNPTAGLGIGAVYGGSNTNAECFDGDIDEVHIYNRALSQIEVKAVMSGIRGQSSSPNPADEAIDVVRDVVLDWMAGEFADKHDVYFGTNFDDVNDATNLDPMGPDKVYRAHQDPNRYPISGTLNLDFGETYYWRIDEVNAPPYTNTVVKGEVWQFTTEPVGYPIAGEKITATASSNQAGKEPENTINGSGLTDDLHGTNELNMWLSGSELPGQAWIEYEFDQVYKLHEMWVWNYNSSSEGIIGFGLKDVTIEYSENGTDYTTLGTTHEFAPALGEPAYQHNTEVAFDGVVAKCVKLTANSNWGSIAPNCGLSEVRFFSIPVWARYPNPNDEAAGVSPDVVLSWRQGREAATHDVYLSTDEQAVIEGTITPVSIPATESQASYHAGILELDKTYYWKITEVNMAEPQTTWEGEVWSFTTPEYLIVDDFESYDDLCNRIFYSWTDGFGHSGAPSCGVAPSAGNGTGSTVGHVAAPFAEQTIIYEGRQSMPFAYDNSAAPFYSETERTFDTPQDWTGAGVKALTLYLYGNPDNDATSAERLYVALGDSFGQTASVFYDANLSDMAEEWWHEWHIDLKQFSDADVSLTSIKKMYIGVGDRLNPQPGGTGKLYFDDVRLYPCRCLPARTKPTGDTNNDCKVDFLDFVMMADDWHAVVVAPSPAGLVGHYEFEGNLNDSAGSIDGSPYGDPTYGAGPQGFGTAIYLDGDDYVDLGSPAEFDNPDLTYSAWVKTTSGTDNMRIIVNQETASSQFILIMEAGRIVIATQASDQTNEGMTSGTYNDGQWHHVAAVRNGDSIDNASLFIDGKRVSVGDSGTGALWSMAGTAKIGAKVEAQYYFTGFIDDVRIYNYALTQAEIWHLAGLPADLNEDNKVDFKDCAVLADRWLDEQLWP